METLLGEPIPAVLASDVMWLWVFSYQPVSRMVSIAWEVGGFL